MKTSATRRHVLRSAGAAIALPLLESALPRGAGLGRANAAGAPKKRFVGCFFPNGAPMPKGANGDWGYSGSGPLGGALKPLAALGVEKNVSILRGFRAVNNWDVHWSGCAAFMACVPVGVGKPGSATYQVCGKTFDQHLADLQTGVRIRSLHAGWHTLASWDVPHDSNGSINYVNYISWKDTVTPISNTMNPQQMFTQVFGSGTPATAGNLQYMLSRKKSILDGVLGQYKALRGTLPSGDQTKLDGFAQGIRDIEGELVSLSKAPSCKAPAEDTSAEPYYKKLRTMHKIIVAALQCDVTRVATVMYNDGIANHQILKTVSNHHGVAHGDWTKLMPIVQVQVGLWGEFVAELKAAGLLRDTVVVLGSNMSDGAAHNPTNIPLLVASENVANEMKLGQEIYGVADPAMVAVNSANRNLADLYVDLFKLYGVERTFGSGKFASTGMPSGILA
jgi:hypothetical protein